MAMILHNNGKYDEALQMLQQIKIDNSERNDELKLAISEIRAIILNSMGNYEKALQLFN